MNRTALDRYHAKRDFGRTREPEGRVHPSPTGRSFVVQKHDARRLHYDFRLELDGVLKSWAVPKGPSLSPKDKRLAVQTEDHPVDYRDFEGTIPEGQYGGGPVIVWDRGEWEAVGDPHEGLDKGHLEIVLHGDKLRGRFTLVRLRDRDGAPGRAPKSNWLLIKRRDDFVEEGAAADVVRRAPKSVLTGRTIEQVERGVVAAADGERASKLPAFGSIAPELATLVREVPRGDEWVFEPKYDGYRGVATLEDGRVRIASRNGKDWTARFSSVADALSRVRARTAVFDGEIAYVTEDGRTDFQRLQNAMSEADPSRIVYFVFDLLYYDGVDLRSEPLEARKDKLRTILAGEGPPLRMGDHASGDGEAFRREACRLGLEGIVAKRARAPYRSGRGHDWLKIKCEQRQEMIIVGFTPPSGGRTGLGALLLGVHEDGRLRYAGKVGTGFTEASLADLHRRLSRIVTPEATVEGAPRMKDVTWVKPELVCQVRFSEWTNGGALRHPSFEGLREDKAAGAITRERPEVRPKAERPKRARSKMTTGTRSAREGGRDAAKRQAGAREPKGLTHGERVVDPTTGTTKADVARYFEQMAPSILRYAERRPLMLVRCTDAWQPFAPRRGGVRSSCFVQKHAGRGLDGGVGHGDVLGEEVLFLRQPEDLMVLAQLNVVELHGWGSRMPKWGQPDWIVFDLDPDEGLPFSRVVEAARELRDELEALGLESFVKTTGGKGLHVVVPLRPRDDWDTVRAFAEAVARGLAQRSPEAYVAKMSKAARKDKIFIDYLRNGRGATAILPYSPRARPGATVAVPVAWSELGRVDPRELTLTTVPRKDARRRKDPWEGFLATSQTLPARVTKALREGDARAVVA